MMVQRRLAPLDKYVMVMKIVPHRFDEWSRSYRERLEPIIRARFASRGQAAVDADRYVNEVCWEHPMIALRHLMARRRF